MPWTIKQHQQGSDTMVKFTKEEQEILTRKIQLYFNDELEQEIGQFPARLRAKADKTRLSSFDPSIKLMTMHSSKGLEYPMVIVSGVSSMPDKHANASTETKLLYVAMTRATDKLLVTAHQPSEFTDKLASPRLA